MDFEEELLEPYKLYKEGHLLEQHQENVAQYFDELSNNANVNIEENRLTCKNYYQCLKEIEVLKKKGKSYLAKKKFYIIALIISWVIGTFCISECFQEGAMLTVLIPCACVLILGPIGLFWAIAYTKKKIASLKEEIQKLEAKANQLLSEAYSQMAPLNSAYDWNIPATLFSKTLPLIELDQYFDREKFQYMHEKYGFLENKEDNISSVLVQSGAILGNPFVLERNYVQKMEDHTYSNSIKITWTTVHTGKNGTYTVTHSETLTAEVVKPRPAYYLDTWLVYANDAAPKLTFFRQPTNANLSSERSLEKFVSKSTKEMEKREKREMMDDDDTTNFTSLGNKEFESLFNAMDRDNEMEYRLLFTPLAQKNFLSLMKSKEPFGDDFMLKKEKMLNFVKTNHGQNANYEGDPKKYYNFDYDKAKNFFINDNVEYMRNLYFDMIPLLSIPLYQQNKNLKYIYGEDYYANVTSFETEVLANSYNQEEFRHPESDTNAILKCDFGYKNGNADMINIRAYSFKAIKHTEYIAKRGGDGKRHTIPVDWYEYQPLEQVTPMAIQEVKVSKSQYDFLSTNDSLKNFKERFGKENGMIFQRGLLSLLLKDNNYNNEELNRIFSQKEETDNG